VALQEAVGDVWVRYKRLPGLQLQARALRRVVSPLPPAPRADGEPGRGLKGDDRGNCLDGERPPLRLTARGAALRQAFGDPILADRIALDHRRAGLDERRTAILDYAVKVTGRPLDCTPEDLARLEGPWPDGIGGLGRRGRVMPVMQALV
jgi:hypothetical protein